MPDKKEPPRQKNGLTREEAIKKATANRARRPSPLSGAVLPPGFEAHPERRGSGGWKKSENARWQLEQVCKMSQKEVAELANDESKPMMLRRFARSMLKENNWKTTEGMLNQIYGAPKQTMEVQQVDPKPLIDLTEVNEAEVKEDGEQSDDSAE